jgi:alkanesulfonate monooxygenase SsuD/methylene tetrahydromethanopterin reductase-like flavin-dependent oxidoreductase (luciferase family)
VEYNASPSSFREGNQRQKEEHMTDYGQELQFGTFITPTNAYPMHGVDLAVRSEQAGLDLVTFQDHPYQPSFLDTWTLLSFVAARTEKIKISGNVLNLPLRPPAVLARATASLDLLSDGRFELGLGAGAFWDPMVAMGVDRLTAGQSVEALDEAIDLIRELWDTDKRERLTFTGEYYQLDGAKRGPAPAHRVEFWLGALKPRMLRLIGRKADGWLPSLMYLASHEDLAGMNQIIDQAAHDAGREPHEIRRMLNVAGKLLPTDTSEFLAGSPEKWAQDLAFLTRTYGTSTFILASDSGDFIDLFGQEIAPRVREIVGNDRASN